MLIPCSVFSASKTRLPFSCQHAIRLAPQGTVSEQSLQIMVIRYLALRSTPRASSRNATVRGHVPKASFSCTRPAHAHNFCAKAPFSFLGTTAVYYIVNLRNFIRKITRSWALIRYPSHGSSPCRNMNIHSGKLQSVP